MRRYTTRSTCATSFTASPSRISFVSSIHLQKIIPRARAFYSREANHPRRRFDAIRARSRASPLTGVYTPTTPPDSHTRTRTPYNYRNDSGNTNTAPRSPQTRRRCTRSVQISHPPTDARVRFEQPPTPFVNASPRVTTPRFPTPHPGVPSDVACVQPPRRVARGVQRPPYRSPRIGFLARAMRQTILWACVHRPRGVVSRREARPTRVARRCRP